MAQTSASVLTALGKAHVRNTIHGGGGGGDMKFQVLTTCVKVVVLKINKEKKYTNIRIYIRVYKIFYYK